jgi:hypothetical protein
MPRTVIGHESAELGRMERVDRGAPPVAGIVRRYC